jgi:hypothetical protein
VVRKQLTNLAVDQVEGKIFRGRGRHVGLAARRLSERCEVLDQALPAAGLLVSLKRALKTAWMR